MNYFSNKLYLLVLSILVFVISCRKQPVLDSRDGELENSGLLAQFSKERGLSIKVLAYNTFLLRDIAGVPTTQWSQDLRAKKMGSAPFINNYDVLLFQECFDNRAATTLRQQLSTKFPYQTPILGQTKEGWDNTAGDWREVISGGFENGGVMIASKYPIEVKNQYIFPRGCDFDALALKGFVYVRILKDGKRMHFISTHLQSTQPGCKGNEVSIRKDQLEAIKAYITELNIPKDEIVVYGGDFNIIRDSPEYPGMLQALKVLAPRYKGLPATWDTKTNTMASYHYPYPANKQEYLDYIFVSSDHLVPDSWQNIVFDPVTPSLMSYTNMINDQYYWTDYSDHYPVEGNIYSDAVTPVSSMKFRKYDRVSLRSVASGKYITANLATPDDWLKVTASFPTAETWFNLVNTGGGNTDYFDLKEGAIRVEISERINHFWYWGSAYYYYPKFGKSLKDLELVIVKKKSHNTSSSVEQGDIVAFRDKTSAGNTYYLQVYQKNGTDWMFLNGRSAGIYEQFEVHINNTSAPNW